MVEFIVKINQHLRLKHAAVVPTGLFPIVPTNIIPVAPIGSLTPEVSQKVAS